MVSGTWILRVGLAIVFAGFCILQIQDPNLFKDSLPSAIQGSNASVFVLANAILDGLLALSIGFGIFPKIAPFIGALHLFIIAFAAGMHPDALRDFALAMACLSLVFIHEEHLDGRERAVLARFFGAKKH